MLDPLRRILVAAHVGLVGQFEKGEDVAVPRVEEDVHIGIIFAGRRHMILGERGRVGHAEHGLVPVDRLLRVAAAIRSEEHTSELQSLMRISYAVSCLKKKKKTKYTHNNNKDFTI